MEALTIKDIEDFLNRESKEEKQNSFTLIIGGHKDSVAQWIEIFHKEIREQCGKI